MASIPYFSSIRGQLLSWDSEDIFSAALLTYSGPLCLAPHRLRRPDLPESLYAGLIGKALTLERPVSGAKDKAMSMGRTTLAGLVSRPCQNKIP